MLCGKIADSQQLIKNAGRSEFERLEAGPLSGPELIEKVSTAAAFGFQTLIQTRLTESIIRIAPLQNLHETFVPIKRSAARSSCVQCGQGA